MIASIQTPFPYYYSISLDYHHWPHFEIPFAKVSWVRHRDIHILTAGAYTYTSDQRFQALHRQNTGQNSEWSEWTLCIKWAQERDQGLYECQISTIPVKSHQFRLNVVSKSPSSRYIYIYSLYKQPTNNRVNTIFCTNKIKLEKKKKKFEGKFVWKISWNSLDSLYSHDAEERRVPTGRHLETKPPTAHFLA